MSLIYNYIFSNDYTFEPTDALRHQKFLIHQQLVKSNLNLRNTDEIKRLEREKELVWYTLIQVRKRNKKKNKK